jgi:acyl-CoA thioesterase-1
MYNKISIFIIIIIFIGLGIFFVNKNSLTRVATNQVEKATTVESTSEDPYTIIAFGDSLTAGYGVPLVESYPSQLESELNKRGYNVRVINMGVSGETTTAGLERVSFVLSQNPDLVLLGLGANDMLRSSSPSIAKKNIEAMLIQFKDANIPVVLLGMRSTSSNGPVYTKEFDAIYPTLAKEYSLPLVPFFLDGVALRPSLNTSDGIHPNKEGYEKIINNNILDVLLPLLTK